MMNKAITLVYSASLSLFSSICLAVENGADINSAKTLTNSPINTATLLDTLVGLFLVLATIILLAWLVRRTGRFQTAANSEMKIIAALSLGTRERAILLQVGEQQILVGVTSQQIQTLHVLDNPIYADQADSNNNFAEKLQQMIQKRQSS